MHLALPPRTARIPTRTQQTAPPLQTTAPPEPPKERFPQAASESRSTVKPRRDSKWDSDAIVGVCGVQGWLWCLFYGGWIETHLTSRAHESYLERKNQTIRHNGGGLRKVGKAGLTVQASRVRIKRTGVYLVDKDRFSSRAARNPPDPNRAVSAESGSEASWSGVESCLKVKWVAAMGNHGVKEESTVWVAIDGGEKLSTMS